MGGTPVWWLGECLTSPHRKSQLVTKCYTGPPNSGPVDTVMSLRVP
jgi:hypothetical protein